MSPSTRDSSTTVLSSNVHMPTPPLKVFQESFLYLQNQLYMIMVNRSGECKMMMLKNFNRHKALAAFHATDRTVNEDNTEYDRYHEVLELVLSDQHAMGRTFSTRYAALVECRDGLEVVLSPPRPKGTLDNIQGAFSYMKKVPPFNRLLKESDEDESEPEKLEYRMVDSQAVEMLLCQDPYYEKVTKQISVVGRRASPAEIKPYDVEFHYSQKEWYERLREWLVKNFQEQVEGPLPPFVSDDDATLMRSYTDRSRVSFAKPPTRRAKKKIPNEIKVVTDEPVEKSPPTIMSRGDHIWIAEHDIALGVHQGVHPDLKATTYANAIFERRVLAYFASKKTIRQSHIWVMKLMLQEELEDDVAIQLAARRGTTFWVKLSDCTGDEGKRVNSETKWLRKRDGDFIGPFVKASDSSIYNGVVTWIDALRETLREEPRDPEPSRDPEPCPTRSFATCEQETLTQTQTQEGSTIASRTIEEETDTSVAKPNRAQQEKALPKTIPEQKGPAVFDLSGPIETLDKQAKEVCQKWIDNSDTLLIKAAKKSLIDSFQGDFHSFLFLFQLQLKRIRGGYAATKLHAAQPNGADDASWVSADPSVQEEDTRIADIEKACIGFMNQMGNTMVKRYQEMTGDTGSKTSEEQRDDELAEEKAEKVVGPSNDAGQREDGKNSSSPKSVPRSRKGIREEMERLSNGRKGIREETNRISRGNIDDPAVIDKDDTTYEKTVVSKSYDSETDVSASTPERWLKQVYDRNGRLSPRARQAMQNKRAAAPPRRGRNPIPQSQRSYPEDESDDDQTSVSYYERSFDEPSRMLSQSASQSFTDRSQSRSFTERSQSPDPSRSRRSRKYDYPSPPQSNTFTDDDTYPTMETGHLESVSLVGSDISLDPAPSIEKPNDGGWLGLGLF